MHRRFEGKPVFKQSATDMRALRREMQIIFQDPYASLNPRLSIEETIIEPMIVHGIGTPKDRRDRATALL